MSQKGKRTATEQARTARFLLAQMITQIAEYEEHMAKPRSVRRMEIRLGMFDSTIVDRIGQLREQRAKWEARLAELAPAEKAEREYAERVEHDKGNARQMEREAFCTGGGDCPAGAHWHGCLRDDDGSVCDEPQAHPVKREG